LKLRAYSIWPGHQVQGIFNKKNKAMDLGVYIDIIEATPPGHQTMDHGNKGGLQAMDADASVR